MTPSIDTHISIDIFWQSQENGEVGKEKCLSGSIIPFQTR